MPFDRKRRVRRGHDDLHGNAPDQSQAVLLLIDVINDLNFPDNKHLVRRSVALAKSIAKLKKRCKKLGIPTIYVQRQSGPMAFRYLRRIAALPPYAIPWSRNDEPAYAGTGRLHCFEA